MRTSDLWLSPVLRSSCKCISICIPAGYRHRLGESGVDGFVHDRSEIREEYLGEDDIVCL